MQVTRQSIPRGTSGGERSFCELPEAVFIRLCFKFATPGLHVAIKHTNTVVSAHSVAVCASKIALAL